MAELGRGSIVLNLTETGLEMAALDVHDQDGTKKILQSERITNVLSGMEIQRAATKGLMEKMKSVADSDDPDVDNRGGFMARIWIGFCPMVAR